jgi:TIR domain
VPLVEALASRKRAKPRQAPPPCFFISYARARPEEADFVEAILRRRDCLVVRDEKDFGAGRPLPGEIVEHIHQASVFVALWCKEYACSPWCFDELDLALERRETGALTLWLLQIDDTRIVPPAARGLISYWLSTRDELEGRVLKLLGEIQTA